jgi:hypothetical protein
LLNRLFAIVINQILLGTEMTLIKNTFALVVKKKQTNVLQRGCVLNVAAL